MTETDKLIVAGTGHRPDKLGGWNNTSAFYKTVEVAIDALEEHSPSEVISGGACGWDLALAHAAMELGFPLTMAIPFEGQESRWSDFWKQLYGEALEYATKREVIFEAKTYEEVKRALLGRNTWMVENCDLVLAMWNGSQGGTAHCIREARRLGKPYVNYWGKWITHTSHESNG